MSGIPHPIQRVYPDRRYRYAPVLVSGMEPIHRAPVETDDEIGDEDSSDREPAHFGVRGAASSPSLPSTSRLDGASAPRRSFSIGDMLSVGPQPLWRRPTNGKARAPGSRLLTRGGKRVASAPQTAMGGSLSKTKSVDVDPEPPTKRRDVANGSRFLGGAKRLSRATSSSRLSEFQTRHEIQLGLESETPGLQHYTESEASLHEAFDPPETPLSFKHLNWPAADVHPATTKPARVSTSRSEITSSGCSDSERRSVGELSSDYQSDAVYDSYPTRTTRSSSGKRGPHIETLFHESPPAYSSGRSTRLKDLLHDGCYVGNECPPRHRPSIIEEEESVVSTPRRSLHESLATATPPAQHGGGARQFGSSPPLVPNVPVMPDPDDINWDGPDDSPPEMDWRSPTLAGNGTPLAHVSRFGGPLWEVTNTTPGHAPTPRPTGERTNPFEWSEMQPSPKFTSSPQRPRTVHGKKDPENRGSRAAGRRAPSAMHARSHSVPVVPDVDGKRCNAVANKFGTWGVGSKGVTEDWNEDFDFDDLAMPDTGHILSDEKTIDSGHEMFVPKSIREQQHKVLANIGLLKEWGLLIEELKELRIRALSLDMINGPYAGAWEEVDAMIELADQETEEHTVEPRKTPPSSPSFDSQAFDDDGPRVVVKTPGEEMSLNEIISSDQTISRDTSLHSLHPTTPLQHNARNRPRKDSEAVARSVIEALQSRRSVSDSAAMDAAGRRADNNGGNPTSKKVPFDTAALRHIVPYVNGLKRKVKDALRETEGLYSSPRRRGASSAAKAATVSNDDEVDDRDAQAASGKEVEFPAFRSIFDDQGSSDPNNGPAPAKERSRRIQAMTDHDQAATTAALETDREPSDASITDFQGDLARRMREMNLP